MHWMLTPVAAILFFITALVVIADWMIWIHRKASGGMALLGLISAALICSLTGALEAASVGLSQKLFWSKLSYFGIAPAAPLLLLFTLILTHRKSLITPIRSAIFWSIPALTVVLATTNDMHHLIWASTDVNVLPEKPKLPR